MKKVDMKRLFPVFILAVLLSSCGKADSGLSFTEALGKSQAYADIQEYEMATDYALSALKSASSDAQRSLGLSHLAALDLMTWRDVQAWEHAVEAEKLARRTGVDSLVAEALLQKGRVCAYAGVTQEETRDDEALAYFQDALKYARLAASVRQEVESLYNLSQVYVNKNRFNDPIDPVLYKVAGDYLDQGVELASSEGLSGLVAKSLIYKMRYFRQKGRTTEGIACCREILSSLRETDYLQLSQVYNQLVMLYALENNADESAAAHQQYVYAMEHYMQQKADSRLQEMESAYKASVQESRARLFRTLAIMLLLLALILVAGILQSVRFNRQMKVQNIQLTEANRAKEQLLHLVSQDLTSPAFNKELTDSIRSMQGLSEEEVRKRCQDLLKEDSDLAAEVAHYIVSVRQEREKTASGFGLTSREMEILRYSSEGLSAAEIAEKLFISVHTVNNHKQNIYSKMDVRSNVEMLAKARSVGIL